MRKPILLLIGGLCLVFFTVSGNKEPQFKGEAAINAEAPKPATLKVDKDYGKMPLYFIPNQGQMDKQVAYYVQGKDKTLYFTEEGITFALTKPAPREDLPSFPGPRGSFRDVREDKIKAQEVRVQAESAGPKRGAEEGSERWVVKLEFVGANEHVKPVADAETGAVVSYFKGKPQEWTTGLPTYSKIVYPNLWPGIDLVYSGTVNKLKYEFIVHPWADPSKIRLAYRGAAKVSVDGDGCLQVKTPAGTFNDDVPAAYQEVGGKRVAVSLAYRLKSSDKKECFQNSPSKKPEARISDRAHKNSQEEKSETQACIYSFEVGRYDRSQTLVLDPAILVYCGYIGGSWGSNQGYGIAVDGSGNAYVIGYTLSTEAMFPVMVGPDLTFNGNSDAFVAKVNPTGTALVYCGYIGGSLWDVGFGIAADSSGNAYVTGYTTSTEATFPVIVGPDLTHNGGSEDAFVAKVNAAGTALVYCGYIGGSYIDEAYGIAVDGSGNAYVTGYTESTEATFPVIVGPDLSGGGDAFVAKVNAAGVALVYCGYIGGSLGSVGKSIAVDTSGNAYVTGYTASTEATFPVTVGPDLTYNGRCDAFVAKVNSAGTALDYCGYIGGSDYDRAYGIAVDGSGNAYVTGYTASTEATFPVIVGPDLTFNGREDAFVAKINSAGTALDYCGYIGGSDYDGAYGIAVDGSGNAYVIGWTVSSESTFPVIVGPDLTYNGNADTFVAKVNSAGTALVYCGYIGGYDYEEAYGIAVDGSGNAYVTGYTYSSEATFPVIVGPYLTYQYEDVFVAKVSYYGPGTPHLRTPLLSIDFGNVNVGRNLDLTTVVHNDGDVAIIINNIVRSSGSTEFAYLDPSTPLSVAPGGSQAITVRFAPLSLGQQSAQFTVDSNDPDMPSAAFRVTGVGATISFPDINLPSTSLSFGDVKVNSSIDLDFLIQNLGDAYLTINGIFAMPGSSEFSIASFPSSIPGGGSGYAKIRFSPVTTGGKSADFEISSNDPDEANVIFTASGVGVFYDSSPSNHKILPEAIWAPATGGGDWVTEVQITDLTGGSIVSAYFSYGGGNRRGPFSLWLGPGMNSSAKFTNILSAFEYFDSGSFAYYGRVGAVDFVTQDREHKIQVAARTLNGNCSKILPGFNLNYSNTADTTRRMMIQKLVKNFDYRSTCGFYNPTADPVTVVFWFLEGVRVGLPFTKSFVGYDFQAFNPFDEAGLPPPYRLRYYDNVFLLINPTSGTGRLMCFGASANKNTNDPAAHIAVQYQGTYDNSPSNYQILPEAIWAPATGGGTWVSEVQIADLTGGSVVSVYFDYGGGARRGPLTLWTNSGRAYGSGKFANILSSMQSLEPGFTYYGRVGAIEFLTQDASHRIQVAARTLIGNYSKTLPAFNLTDSNTAVVRRKMMIQGLINTETYRSSCGFFNPTLDPVTVEFRLIDRWGGLRGAAFTQNFVGYDFQAFNPFDKAGLSSPNDFYDAMFLLINPISGTGKLMCFGASANNNTNDPAAHIAVQYQ